MSGALGVTRILHVSVNTSRDPDGVRGFYADLLGPAVQRPQVEGIPGTWFAGAQVHLVEAPGDGPRGLHWCLGVRSLPDAVEALRERGVPLEHGSQTWPDGTVVHQVWFTDPTGAVVELQQDPTG
jgi:catechol 2,3-dioxygenase-like lactoylglutathione lyase family enzyme